MDYLSEEDAKRFLNGGSSPQEVYNRMKGEKNASEILYDVLSESGFKVDKEGEESVAVLNAEGYDELVFNLDTSRNNIGLEVSTGLYGEVVEHIEWRDERDINGQEDKIKSEVRTFIDQLDLQPE
jgi:hypothetical protein